MRALHEKINTSETSPKRLAPLDRLVMMGRMSASAIHGVGLTSLWIAATRAVESESESPLFCDPYARTLAGERGFEVLRSLDALSTARPPTLEMRTRFLDDEMTAAARGGTRQIVSLAAGMDARAYRLDWPAGTIYFELDQPDVLAYKEEKLSDASPRCDRRSIGVDLREDWPADLRRSGFDANASTLWLVEGLLPYLHEPQATELLSRITQVASAGDVLLFDILGRSVFASPWVRYLVDFVAGLGAPWHFGSDEPESLLAPLGWDVEVTEVGVIGHRLGRWPFPLIPRGTPGVPQSFFVKATKRA